MNLLQQDPPQIKFPRYVGVDDFNRLAKKLPRGIGKRVCHVVEVIGRSNQPDAIREAGDLHNFSRLMDECHIRLRDLYEVSCPELNTMVNIACFIDGCCGKRLTMPGFGGYTVNLVANGTS